MHYGLSTHAATFGFGRIFAKGESMLTILFVTFLQIAPVDTANAKLFKRITTEAEFVMLDKQHSDRAIIRDKSVAGIAANFVLSEEMDCFLANHQKDPLRLTYEIYQSESDGKTVMWNKATRIVSLKTGDDTKNWKEKETADAEVASRHHEELKKLRSE
jgi:hypothetical protein